MDKPILRLFSVFLAFAVLTGCGIVPAKQDAIAENQDVFISQVPLVPKDNLSATAGDSSAEEKKTDPQEDISENAPETNTDEPVQNTPDTGEAESNHDTDEEENTQQEEESTTESEETQAPPADETPEEETSPPANPPADQQEEVEQAVESESVTLSTAPAAIPEISKPEASGVLVKSNDQAIIDYSNTADGYVMVQYTASTTQRLKVQVKGPVTTYTYNLTPQQWAAFPLSDENGEYQIVVYQNVVDTKYAAVLSATVTVSMEDEFAPFIRSNQYVNFDAAPATVATAASLAGHLSDPLQKVGAIYNFVVYGMHYDTELAATVTSGYLPDLDTVLAKMSGICFDYAALMTGMLRSQGVPTKLVIGYAGDVYHAWINVWSDHTGWVEGVVYFDGANWKRMDPTFASSGGSAVMDYIGDGSNYSAKYFY